MSPGDSRPRILDGKVAVITVGGRGIGRAIALNYAEAGAAVMVSARTTNEIEETADLIRAAGGRAASFPADVSDLEAVRTMLAVTEAELGAPSILVNNAGGGIKNGSGPYENADIEGIRGSIETNMMAAMLLSRLVLPGMLDRRQGCIVNMASGSGMVGMPYMAAYCVAKTGIIRFSESLALEMLGRGVTVFSVAPGNVATKLTTRLTAAQGEKIPEPPPGRPWLFPPGHELEDSGWYLPERAAELCRFLASGKADRLSGRFFSVHYDEAAIVAEAERVEREQLYALRIPTLKGVEPPLYYRDPEAVRAAGAAS